jgi:hypothetical protein
MATLRRGRRTFFEIPRNRGTNTTLLSSMSLEGMGPSMAIEGSTTKEVFEAYIASYASSSAPIARNPTAQRSAIELGRVRLGDLPVLLVRDGAIVGAVAHERGAAGDDPTWPPSWASESPSVDRTVGPGEPYEPFLRDQCSSVTRVSASSKVVA